VEDAVDFEEKVHQWKIILKVLSIQMKVTLAYPGPDHSLENLSWTGSHK